VWGRDAERVSETCRRFEAKPWPDSNPPEIVISTLPPEASLPGDLIAQLRSADMVMDANYGDRSRLAQPLNREVIPAMQCWRPKLARASIFGSRISIASRTIRRTRIYVYESALRSGFFMVMAQKEQGGLSP